MSINAILKLGHVLENNQTFPQFQELLPHLQAEAQEQRVNLQALEMILRSIPAGREICFTVTAWASHPATTSSFLEPLRWRQVLWVLHLQLPGGTTLSSCSRKASCTGSARTWRSQYISRKTRPLQARRAEGMKVRPLVEIGGQLFREPSRWPGAPNHSRWHVIAPTAPHHCRDPSVLWLSVTS